MACAFTHGQQGQPGKSRCMTLTMAVKDEYVPMLCLQCDNAACVQVCPVFAISRNEQTGVVHVDMDKCMLCMACTVACPFGNMHFDAPNRAVVKCDLCAGYGDSSELACCAHPTILPSSEPVSFTRLTLCSNPLTIKSM